MNYYKLIKQENIIGAITSNDFIVYSPSTDCYMSCTDLTGEYANYKNTLYRDTWMQPFQLYAPHEMVLIISISQEEYNIIIEALKTKEIVPLLLIETKEPEPLDNINILDESTLEFIKLSKIQEMSYACRTTIEQGFDLIIRGVKFHFSLSTQDQLNLMSLSAMAQTEELIPYHADGEECMFYTAEEIKDIANTANLFKMYHTTYYNSLKNYINALETIEEISKVTYGMEIPNEYKTEVLRALESEMLI